MSREYLPKIIDDAFNRVRPIPRRDVLQKVQKTNERQVLALTYHPAMPSVSGIIRKHWAVITGLSNELKRCVPKPGAYRRSKTLKDHLIR